MTTAEQIARNAGATDADLARPVTYRDLFRYVDSLAGEIKKLKARAAEVETKAMRFRGVHQPAEDYTRGDLVTHQGALWHCNRPTTDRPGSGGTDWQLAVKSGGAS
ncbi:hypothetical protein ACFCQI_14240 [Rhodanobacter sp. FW102-FHT14D06]|uniref:Uncharacterized protein n=2 Tax=unclassified Rhodanobacter TaxID=2621553 RepID=A0AB74UUD3_9GAMM